MPTEDTQPQAQPLPPLNQIYFYLTEGCNLACRHCWIAPRFDPTGKDPAALPVQLFEQAIVEAKPLGLSGVKLTGGEPLLHPQFDALLEIVARHEVGLTIETNGVLMTPERAAAISRFPNRFVSVSMDGADAATHEWVRGVAGSFEGAKRGVRLLVESGTRPQIIFSVMKGNVHHVDAIVGLAEELGAESVKYNLVQPTARGEKMHEAAAVLTVPELIELGRHVENGLASSTKLRIFYSHPPAFRPLGKLAAPGGCGRCGIFGIIGVLGNGQYALCGIGETVPDLVFGRVGVDPLATVWAENTMLQQIRQGLPAKLEGVCDRCLMKHMCLGECIAQNYYRSHSLWAPFWFCEEAEKAGLFPKSRLVA